MSYDPGDLFHLFWEHWDEDNPSESVREISMEYHIRPRTVRNLCIEMGLMEDIRKYNSKKREFKYPEPLSTLVQWSLCPRCLRRLNIERIPFTKCWQVHCYTCGYIGSLPEGYCYEEEQ